MSKANEETNQVEMVVSCLSCKYLYFQETGYSNYTVLDTEINCALDKNKNLPAYEPWGWKINNPCGDNWDKTSTSRCSSYSKGECITLDIDGEDGPADESDDEEQIEAICKHSGRGRHGV